MVGGECGVVIARAGGKRLGYYSLCTSTQQNVFNSLYKDCYVLMGIHGGWMGQAGGKAGKEEGSRRQTERWKSRWNVIGIHR